MRQCPSSPPKRASRLSFLILVGALVALAAGAFAAAPPAGALTPEDAARVRAATAYLQGLATAKGRFVQTDARGGVSQGVFYLQRPGRARFDYDPPSGLAIASDGHEVSVVDRRLKTIQSYPLAMTPLALLLARDIRLDRGVTISQVAHTAEGFTVVARDSRKKTQGQIALTFSDSPLALAGWAVTDAQGATVRVRLLEFSPSPPREARFFELYDHAARSGVAGAR